MAACAGDAAGAGEVDGCAGGLAFCWAVAFVGVGEALVAGGDAAGAGGVDGCAAGLVFC